MGMLLNVCTSRANPSFHFPMICLRRNWAIPAPATFREHSITRRGLPGRQVRLRSDSAGKEVPGVPVSNVGKPRLDRGSGLLGDLELHRTARLLLNYGRAVTEPTADADIVDLQLHEIASWEF